MSREPKRLGVVGTIITVLMILGLIAATGFLVWKCIDMVNLVPENVQSTDQSVALPTETQKPTEEMPTETTVPPTTTEPPQPETVVATVPVGYADGYRRGLSGKFYCLVHGQKAPILGRICMDQMMVDVTHIPQTKPGDRVTLVGTDGGETITMEQIAAAADSFNYEFVCGISRRVPRIYVSGGENIHSVHYLTDPFE